MCSDRDFNDVFVPSFIILSDLEAPSTIPMWMMRSTDKPRTPWAIQSEVHCFLLWSQDCDIELEMPFWVVPRHLVWEEPFQVSIADGFVLTNYPLLRRQQLIPLIQLSLISVSGQNAAPTAVQRLTTSTWAAKSKTSSLPGSNKRPEDLQSPALPLS